ncbi:hypothetical protein [Undibacterium sp. Xuan67W]|uniref:hypothetical protein n=1 Tax=Undibacterium sp. Xuan67W TaxID=3413057 RepID=UPI003BF348DA
MLKPLFVEYDDVTELARAQWLQRLPDTLSRMKEYLGDKDIPWGVYEGDLHIKNGCEHQSALIVNGNLTIDGVYDDGLTGLIIVLGDMRVHSVISWAGVAVSGDLYARDLVYAYYNDFTFEVGGTVHARALVVSDRSFSANKINATMRLRDVNNDEMANYVRAVREFVPEVLVDSVLEIFEDDESIIRLKPNFSVTRERLAMGLPIFRELPAPELVAKDLLAVIRGSAPPSALAALASTDVLIAIVAAARTDLPVAAQATLVKAAHPAVMEILAKNPKVDQQLLDAIAAVSPEVARLAAQHPRASASSISQLLSNPNPAMRETLTERDRLPASVVNQLACDASTDVRLGIVYRHKDALSDATIDVMVGDTDAQVREALIGARLKPQHFSLLAQDPEVKVRLRLAENLVEQALFRTSALLSAADREALALTLVLDQNNAVRFAVMPALSADEQERLWDNSSPVDIERIAYRLAGVTRSVLMMQRISNISTSPDNLKELAKNLALPKAEQMRLMDIALTPVSSKWWARLGGLASSGASKKQAKVMADLMAELVRNPNLHEEVVLRAADHCIATSGKPYFCKSLLQRQLIPLAVLERLKGVRNQDFQNDFALTVLMRHNSTRELIEYAVPLWYDNTKLISEFEKLQPLKDDAWWLALAKAKSEDLREIAARNLHTPPAALSRLSKDKVPEVVSAVASNPASLTHLWPLVLLQMAYHNPALNEAQAQMMLHQAETDSEFNASYIWESIAERQLRACD